MIVGVTTGGDVEVLDPTTGLPLRTLATGATGDEVSVTPDGRSVYFEAVERCVDEIESVPSTGGAVTAVAAGNHPAVSPDGTQLAYMRQPVFTANGANCQNDPQDTVPSALALVVRDLRNASERTYPVSPQVVSTGLLMVVDHLSWAADDRRIALSFQETQDNEGWNLAVLYTSSATYETDGTPVALAAGSSSYYREGVFMPNGDIFANVVCCAGLPPTVTSTLLDVVGPSGAVVHQVAIGFNTADHTSLDSDRTGRWLLYLSGHDLLVSQNGQRPYTLASGFVAAAWG